MFWAFSAVSTDNVCAVCWADKTYCKGKTREMNSFYLKSLQGRKESFWRKNCYLHLMIIVDLGKLMGFISCLTASCVQLHIQHTKMFSMFSSNQWGQIQFSGYWKQNAQEEMGKGDLLDRKAINCVKEKGGSESPHCNFLYVGKDVIHHITSKPLQIAFKMVNS